MVQESVTHDQIRAEEIAARSLEHRVSGSDEEATARTKPLPGTLDIRRADVDPDIPDPWGQLLEHVAGAASDINDGLLARALPDIRRQPAASSPRADRRLKPRVDPAAAERLSQPGFILHDRTLLRGELRPVLDLERTVRAIAECANSNQCRGKQQEKHRQLGAKLFESRPHHVNR